MNIFLSAVIGLALSFGMGFVSDLNANEHFAPALTCNMSAQSGLATSINPKRCCQCVKKQHSAYISSYSSDLFQFTSSTFGFTPVLFENDQSIPKNMIHPVAGDDTQFQIVYDGVYRIEWSALFANNILDGDVAQLRLFNVTANSAYLPLQTVTVPAISNTAQAGICVAGSIIVPLTAGTVLSLQYASLNGTIPNPLLINSPTITMAKISD